MGAPGEDTSRYQKDVHRGGAVFKCDIRENNQCIMIPFDRNGKLRESWRRFAFLPDHLLPISLTSNLLKNPVKVELTRPRLYFDISQDHLLNFNHIFSLCYVLFLQVNCVVVKDSLNRLSNKTMNFSISTNNIVLLFCFLSSFSGCLRLERKENRKLDVCEVGA